MNCNTLIKSMAVLALALSGLTACSDDDDGSEPTLVDQTTPGTVANFLASDPRFRVLAEVANQTGLLSQLDTLSDITVFAPTDAAFNALPDSFLVTQNFVSAGDPDDITSAISGAGLTTLLQAHVVSQNLSSTDVGAASSLATLAGSSISVQTLGSMLILGARAQVVEADVASSNGTIHVIDTVFIPTTQLAAAGEIDSDAFPGTLFDLMEATPLFRRVLSALQSAGESDPLAALADVDTAQTVFVPVDGIDDASDTFFDVHVFPGAQTAADVTAAGILENTALTQLTVDTSTTPVAIEGVDLFATDLAASNGILHLVESVIPPPSQSAADLITTNRSFSTLGAVLDMVDADGSGPGTDSLLDTLRGDGDTFTVFAPNNAAFDALATLGYDTDNDDATTYVDELLADTTTIAAVLRYHVAAGAVDPTATATITTALGEDIAVGTLGALTVFNDLIEVIGEGTSSTGSNNSAVYELGNVLIPDAAGLVRPQVEFPGSSATALAYFTAFSGFNEAAGATDLAFTATVAGGGTAPFEGTVADVLRFVAGDESLLVDEDDMPNFVGELIAPFAVDTDDDDTPDANLDIATTTLFVPLNASLPEDVEGDVIPYHVGFGTFVSTALMDGAFDTLTLEENGDVGRLTIDIDVGPGVTLNGDTTVILPDLVTDNGVIHVISAALVPPTTN